MSIYLLPMLGSRIQFSLERTIAVVTVRRDLPHLDGSANCAAWLGQVTAVRELAAINQGAHFREAAGELSRRDAMEADVAEPRRVHQIAAVREGNHHRADRGLLAPLHLGRDRRGAEELEARLYPVEQARLPYPGRTGQQRHVAPELLGEIIHPVAGSNTHRPHGIPGQPEPP